jgi:hypothetical protein
VLACGSAHGGLIGTHLSFAALKPIGAARNMLARCSPFDASLESRGNPPVRRTEQERLVRNSLIGRHHMAGRRKFIGPES